MKLSGLPPYEAGDAAFRLFCDPAKSERRSADHRKLCERSRYHLRNARWYRLATPAGALQTYTFMPDDEQPRGSVLFAHGWTGEASFMTALVEPLRRIGLRVCLFDFPAHGLSEGRRVNLADCARAMLWTCEALGPFDAVVAHSFGGIVSLWVGEGGPPLPRRHVAKRYVLISCPDRFSDVTRDFARLNGMSDAGRRAYEHRLERIGHRSVASFSASKLLRTVDRPVTLIHCRDDTEVLFSDAEAIAASSRSCKLLPVTGLGHRNILFAPPVMRAVMNELKRPE